MDSIVSTAAPATFPPPRQLRTYAVAILIGRLFGSPVVFVDHDTGERRQQVRIAVRCCYCGETHEHGWTMGPARVESRRSHCHRGEYRIRAGRAGN